jgi:hypothetical protein
MAASSAGKHVKGKSKGGILRGWHAANAACMNGCAAMPRRNYGKLGSVACGRAAARAHHSVACGRGCAARPIILYADYAMEAAS